MSRLPSFWLPCFIAGLLAVSAAVAAPLAEFNAREVVGINWAETLLTYAVAFRPGEATPDRLRLVNRDGHEVVMQLSRVVLHGDGSLASARLSFRAGLKANDTFQFKLLPEKPSAAGPTIDAATHDGALTLDNSLVALRLPAEADVKPQRPLEFSADHAAASLSAGKQFEHGLIPGPIQGLRLADGQWVGGSFFWAANPAEAPKVARFTSRISERGPLFAEAIVRYEFDNGGYYQFTARILAGDPAVRIDEQFDFKRLGLGNTYRLAVALAGNGWKPDYEFHRVSESRLPGRAQPFEDALKRVGIDMAPYQDVSYGSRPIGYDAEVSPIVGLTVWNPWTSSVYYVGLADSKTMAAPPGAGHPIPFMALVPMHAGNWRGAHHSHENIVLSARKPGELELNLPLLVEPHPFSLLQTSEYDPALPPTFGRRQWALVGGPLQYHQGLFALRGYEGFINLDDYKDWIVDWPDRGKTVYPRLLFSREEIEKIRPTLDKHPAAAELKKMLFFNDSEARVKELFQGIRSPVEAPLLEGYGGVPWQSTYRQSQNAAFALNADELLSSARITPEERRNLRSTLAAYCYVLTEPDLNPRGSMIQLGNPNMPINRFMALPVGATLIPDHPMANEWLDVSAAYLRHKVTRNMAPGGGWSELISYFQASTPALLYGGAAPRHSGRLDDATARLLTLPDKFTIAMVTPVDARFGARFMPNWGHEGSFVHTHWLPAAGIIRTVDPGLAKAFAWCWDQMGRPMEDGQDINGWMSRAVAHSDLLTDLPENYIPPEMSSQWLPGFGAVMRAHVGDPDETYFAYRQGYMVSHSDDNQGDFVLYSKGAPLSTLCLFQYGVQHGDPASAFHRLWEGFGWHNRPRFGNTANHDNFGPLSQVHAYNFGDSTDYLRGMGESGPNLWTRQILFMKGKRAAGPNYFVIRDSFANEAAPDSLQPKWWTLRTPGTKDQVKTSPSELNFTSEFGTRLQVHFVQPTTVEVKTQDGSQSGPVYNRAAVEWMAKGRPIVKQTGEASATIAETMTVSSVGPIAAGQDILVVLNPQKPGEKDPKYESLADGVARVTTEEGEDYIFAHRAPLAFKQGDVAFKGLAGAVRVYPNEVHLIIAEGPGEATYKGVTLRSSVSTSRVIPRRGVERVQTIDEPAPKFGVTFTLDAAKGKIEQVEPGVKRQILAHGFAYLFDSDKPLKFAGDGIAFTGRRGGVVVNKMESSVRLVMLDGEAVRYQNLSAAHAKGPYDVTFFHDHITGRSSGEGRFVYLSTPEGLTELPELVIDGVPSAPGTLGSSGLIVPLLPGEHSFDIQALSQPPVWRNWEAW